jgi:hypothetical protein
MTDPEQLIHDLLNDVLTTAGQDELDLWLREDSDHMRRFTEALMFDQEIQRAVQAKESADSADRFTDSAGPAKPHVPAFKPTPNISHRLARAAGWLGAFIWLGDKAKAATTTLLMTKTTSTTLITASVLLLGGGSLYLLREQSERAAARLADLQEGKQALLQTPAADRTSTRTPTQATRSLTANAEYLNRVKESVKTAQVGAHFSAEVDGLIFEEMDQMDLETIRELLIEAHRNRMSSLILERMLETIAARSLADATALSAHIFTDFPDDRPFNVNLDSNFRGYLKDWIKSDPVAAEQWCTAAMASAEFAPKGISEQGQEGNTPHRIIAQARFIGLLQVDPERAVASIGETLPDDIVTSMKAHGEHFSNPKVDAALLSRVVKQLPPPQQQQALSPFLERELYDNYAGTSKWLEALDVDPTLRASLLNQATRAAYANQTITKSQALQMIDTLPDSPEREKARREIEDRIPHRVPGQ